jgi:hypothetical protein
VSALEAIAYNAHRTAMGMVSNWPEGSGGRWPDSPGYELWLSVICPHETETAEEELDYLLAE